MILNHWKPHFQPASKVVNPTGIPGVLYEVSQFDFGFAAAATIVYNRIEMANELISKNIDFCFLEGRHDLFPLISLCLDLKLPKLFECFLFSTITVQSPNLMLNISWKSGSEFILIVLKWIFLKRRSYQWREIDAKTATELLDILLENLNEDHGRLAMMFAFTFGRHEIISKLLREFEWKEKDLLNLFEICEPRSIESFPFNHNQSVDLILQHLPESLVLDRNGIDIFLKVCDRNGFFQTFVFLWNHKRVVQLHSEEWKLSFLFYSFDFTRANLIDYFLQFYSMTDEKEYEFKFQNQIQFKTDLSTCCWLHAFLGPQFLIANGLGKFEIEWHQTLFDVSFYVASILERSNLIIWLLSNETLISDSWWSNDQIQKALNDSCKSGRKSYFVRILKKFPNFDVYGNRNQAIRQLFISSKSTKETHEIFKVLALGIRYNDETDRAEIIELIKSSSVLNKKSFIDLL